ncbi:hypothetical protein [Desulfolucanica intricata]|uniref:hypothetical protein n=1 Tax=Desulfolucanica intricata TaxID=1285191 RepID=UPI0008307D9E|nr:hypothetical protein [Desulfolucanica intricata]
MSGCGSCSACSIGDKAREYINFFGESTVKCPECETEITFKDLPKNNKLTCPSCGAVFKVIRLLLN